MKTVASSGSDLCENVTGLSRQDFARGRQSFTPPRNLKQAPKDGNSAHKNPCDVLNCCIVMRMVSPTTS